MPPRWMSQVLYMAAIYNLAWGTWVILFPNMVWDMVGMAPPNYPQLWQCIGMIVGVYGIGYGLAARDPFVHWPIVLVGLLGKLFGPIGMVQAIATEQLPWRFGMVCIANDLIWWVPFGLILWGAYHSQKEPRTK